MLKINFELAEKGFLNYLLCNSTLKVCTGFVRRQVEALENGALADCELECNGQVIPVNKFMLSTHSKVSCRVIPENAPLCTSYKFEMLIQRIRFFSSSSF